MPHLCVTLLVATILAQTPPITGPQGDPTKGPPIVAPPADSPPQQRQPNNNRDRDRPRDDNRDNRDNRDNSNDAARQRRVIELRRAADSLRQQLNQLDATISNIENENNTYDRLMGNALYDAKVARSAAQSAVEQFNAAVAAVQEATQTQAAAAQEFAAVYARLREKMERTPELAQAMGQVVVATQARAEARAKAIAELARTDAYKNLLSERQRARDTLDKLRSQSAPTAAQTRPASTPEPDGSNSAGPPSPMQQAAAELLRAESALSQLETPALEKDAGFQEADAVYDTVTKRLNLVRAQVEQEWRNDPERVAAQRLADDAQANVKAARALVDERRQTADDAVAQAQRTQMEIVKIDNWRNQRGSDRAALMQRRAATAAELDAIERELASR